MKDDIQEMKEQLNHCMQQIGETIERLTTVDNLEISPILAALYAWSKAAENRVHDEVKIRPDFFGGTAEEYLSTLQQVADIAGKNLRIEIKG